MSAEPGAPASAPSLQPDIRPRAEGEEEAITRLIARCHGSQWDSDVLETWRWRHLRRPGFRRDDVLVAEHEGHLVGCFHGWIMPLCIEQDITIPASFNGDWAVLEAFRGGRLTKRAWKLGIAVQKERNPLVRLGFAIPAVNEGVYRRRFGCVFIPAATIRYRKPLGLPRLAAKVEMLGERALQNPEIRHFLEEERWTIDFVLERFPPFHVTLDSEGFQLGDGPGEGADLCVAGPFALISSVPDGTGAVLRALLRHLLAGRVRVRGAVGVGLRLVRALRRPRARDPGSQQDEDVPGQSSARPGSKGSQGSVSGPRSVHTA